MGSCSGRVPVRPQSLSLAQRGFRIPTNSVGYRPLQVDALQADGLERGIQARR
jgi:hypothetical protein